MGLPFIGGIVSSVTGMLGSIFGGKKTSGQTVNYQARIDEQNRRIQEMQTQLAKKKTPWMLIAVIGGVVLIAMVFLLKR